MHTPNANLTLLNSLRLLSIPSFATSKALTLTTIPENCGTICAPTVQLTNTCDVGNLEDMSIADEERIESTCICKNTSFDVGGITGLCASCMNQNMGSENKTAMLEIDRIMSICSFTTSSYASSATSLLAQVTVQATKPVTSMMPSTTAVTAGAKGQLGATARLESGLYLTMGLLSWMIT